MNEKAYIHALVTAVHNDLSQGLKKDEILQSLSKVISRDLFNKVMEKL